MDQASGAVVVGNLRAEYVPGRALGIGAASPRLSWITTTERAGWMQSAYEIELDGSALGRVDSRESVFVPWPGPPLVSRTEHRVRVRVWGTDDSASTWSEPLHIEAGLLSPDDWTASWITAAFDPSGDESARLRAVDPAHNVVLGKILTTLDVISGGRGVRDRRRWYETEHTAYGFELGHHGANVTSASWRRSRSFSRCSRTRRRPTTGSTFAPRPHSTPRARCRTMGRRSRSPAPARRRRLARSRARRHVQRARHSRSCGT